MAAIINYSEAVASRLTKQGSIRRSRSQRVLKPISIPPPTGSLPRDDEWMLPTPTSADFQFIRDEEEEEEDMRRRRRQKINRTLGERVPERYFAEKRPTTSESGSRSSRSQSRGPPPDKMPRPELKPQTSAHQLSFRDLRTTRSASNTPLPSPPTSSHRSRVEQGDFFPMPSYPLGNSPQAYEVSQPKQRQHDMSHLKSLRPPTIPAKQDQQQKQSHPLSKHPNRSREVVRKRSRSFGHDRPLLSAAPSPPLPLKPKKDDGVNRYEEKQGWSGEWNQADMQSVIRKLRNLKSEP